jgi:hypothetical protein
MWFQPTDSIPRKSHKAKIDLPAALYFCRPEAGARLLE